MYIIHCKKNRKPSRSKEAGLTFIELMVVVLVVGILSGVAITLVNRDKQQNRAKDAVNLVNLAKTTLAIESYYYSEGNYPAVSSDGNPLNGTDGVSLSTYLKTWSEGFVYIYSANPSPSGSFAVYVPRKADSDYYKSGSFSEKVALCDGATENLTTNVDACTVLESPTTGCTDSLASNYNPNATVDDGSCQYPPAPIYGCTDPSATNYNPSATVSDGSCTYGGGPVKGCMDNSACNYNKNATVNDVCIPKCKSPKGIKCANDPRCKVSY
jgi:prepilin-type N-terminal cleavage/methylation domain-containing protein